MVETNIFNDMKQKRFSIIKWVALGMVVVMIAFACASSKNNSMSARQGILRKIYPALTGITRLFGVNNRALVKEDPVAPASSIYDMPFELINGDSATLGAYRGKKMLLVNTASDCGYTAQYEELQKLWQEHKGNLVVVGFPANDFKGQEKGSNEEIAVFCKKNYGVDFPLAAKVTVVKGSTQHPIFTWLSDPGGNGWNKEAPAWNFSKYLLDEEGRLIGYFDPGVSPTGETLQQLLKTSK